MKIVSKNKIKILSLFSGCGGMDIGFEGGFSCFKSSINELIHPDWIDEVIDNYVKLKKTDFEIVFANDIRPDAKAAWVSFFNKYYKNANDLYHLESIVDIVKKQKDGSSELPKDVDIVIGGFPCQDFSIAGKRLGFDSKISHNGKRLNYDEPNIDNRGQLYRV